MTTALERIKKERLHHFAAYLETTMADDIGVIPHHGKPLYTPTGEMECLNRSVVTFGTEGARVVITAYGGDISLTPAEQDLFARHLFRAMDATNLIAAEEVPT